jgi:hypothetical protein
MMFADFDLGDLRPGLIFLVVIVAVVGQAILRGKKLLQDTWTEESWQPKSPGDWSGEPEPSVLRKHPRPAPPPLSVPAPRPTSAPSPGGAWEAELERILRGEPARPVAPPPLPPPPPLVTASRPATFGYNEDSDIESAPAPTAPLARLTEASSGRHLPDQAYAGGASLHDQVAERMRSVNTRIQQHRPAEVASHTAQSAESAAVRNWLRQPETARAAIVAAVIFGRPKALES